MKCRIGETSVKFLEHIVFKGHIVSKKGCKPDPLNIKAIADMKHPKEVKEIRRLLGRCGFYRKHVRNFAQIAKPLTELTKRRINLFVH